MYLEKKESINFNYVGKISLWVCVVKNLYIVWKKSCFCQGVFDGVTGIVRKPIEGAQKEGVEGFFKGIVIPVKNITITVISD